MVNYILRRFISLISVVLVSTLIIFFALSLVPGDPAVLILGQDATPEGLSILRKDLGLDLPLWQQYFNFLKGLTRADLGKSYQRGVPVVDQLATAYPITLILSTLAIIISVVVGLSSGMIAAVYSNTWIDHLLRVFLLATTSIPIYWLGLLLIYSFSVKTPLFPSFGWGTTSHIVLPAITLATFPLAIIGRMTRTTVIGVLSEDYIRTARAKGLSENMVVLKHALPNALIPLVTVIGLQYGIMLAGAVLTETVFAVPGMGRLLITAIFARDYAVIRGAVLLGVFTCVTINFIVDIIYLLIDPRIRYT